ncbi:bifunctional sugar-1-phosphate nucleotidylyltransferase/acetyltransferase [Methanoregula sp. UBA64]|jgi:UDP-N-acetylglucosamine diphosphorylase / glucose-1-phosphate thymidylyltransferase / UDP-N-acetylgalactosamine diphosphorylase / glucosamine-1-phosphate N-acetyltransferase / galactosamine-1-phosphate N-acetyltransferase|uniref:bifunctional sugar-1-phosphate nucleotidylyltransferase/acetyltransferase n=1 Tax=Methanoregula sp. UBA64 TaxID=1915554 RepID=UPI0025D54D8A|nr:bifunctional sugar-1-phosphate nucleotidylyltransferase/acetyltransferase [Methanoregula sp. UBA64]
MECVVLAAGEGKRMRPLTAQRPKVMLPVANRPMMEHLVLAAKDAGITGFVFVVGYGEREVRSYFGDGSRWGVRIRYCRQRQQAGTADALLSARDFVSGPFLAMNGDMILSSADISRIIRTPAPVMGTSTTDHPGDFGVVLLEGDTVTSLEEKSAHPKSNIINAGAYLFGPEIFDLLEKVGLSSRGELELTDALTALIEEHRLRAVPLPSWRDLGYPWDLLDANALLLEPAGAQNDGTIEEGVYTSGKVIVGKGSVIKSGTYIEGPCIIGNNCKIGPHAYIRGATSIGDNCHIGHCTELKNSIIMPGTKIPHFNYIGDSVIGSGCNFGAGTKVANLRHDHAPVRVAGHDTRHTKFGAVVGDNVRFGINCSVNVGSVIGSGAHFAPGSYIHGKFGENATIR